LGGELGGHWAVRQVGRRPCRRRRPWVAAWVPTWCLLSPAAASRGNHRRGWGRPGTDGLSGWGSLAATNKNLPGLGGDEGNNYTIYTSASNVSSGLISSDRFDDRFDRSSGRTAQSSNNNAGGKGAVAWSKEVQIHE